MKLTTTWQLTTYLKLIERRVNQKWFRLNSIVNILKNRDISNQSSGSERRDDRDGAQEKNNNGGATRYLFNIGSRDNFDWMSLKTKHWT
jgi:ATP-dependent RNA helicase DeaD